MTYSLAQLSDAPLLAQLAKNVGRICQTTADFLALEQQSFTKDRIEQKGLNDLVSYVDREAERLTITALQHLLPEAGFITEEGTLSKSDGRTHPGGGTFWIIDPLDGTTNFIHGLGIYAVSIGLLHEGVLVVGAVSVPALAEHFLAWQGGGAWLNGRRIHVSPAQHFGDSLVATGFPYQRFDKMKEYLAVLEHLMQHTHGLRRMGSAAVDLAYVAAGRFEAFFEHNLKAWDCAGGIVLVQEAGGMVTDFAGGTDYLFGGQIIAAGPVHAPLLGLIQETWN